MQAAFDASNFELKIFDLHKRETNYEHCEKRCLLWPVV